MSLLRIVSSAALVVLLGIVAVRADQADGKFSDILNDVDAYGRAIAVARACGMASDRTERAASMVMVYAYAAAQPHFASDEDGKRSFLVDVVGRVSREHEVGKPKKALCESSFKALDHLPARLDEAVRKAG